MILNLTDLSNEPLQSQIVRQIRAKILSGELGAEEALPSIRGMAKDQMVSVITVQRSYEILERENLIHSRRGKGFFVSEIKNIRKKEMAIERLIERLQPVIEDALLEGLSVKDLESILAKVVEQNIAKNN